jgi:hypothetical protein
MRRSINHRAKWRVDVEGRYMTAGLCREHIAQRNGAESRA